MQDFHNLRAWCLAKELATSVRASLPFGTTNDGTRLRGQAISSAESIAANLAEGCGRSSGKEFIVFINYSLGSASEFENHLGAALDGRLIDTKLHYQLKGKLIALGKMIRALRRSIERSIAEEENRKRDRLNEADSAKNAGG